MHDSHACGPAWVRRYLCEAMERDMMNQQGSPGLLGPQLRDQDSADLARADNYAAAVGANVSFYRTGRHRRLG